MLNLVSQSKHHARKHTAILQISYIFARYPKVAQNYISLSGHINTYSFIKYTRE